MAIGMKTGGRDWEPGKEGGPGRPKITEEQRLIRDSLKTELGKIILLYSSMSIDEWKTELKRQDLPGLHAAVIKALVRAVETGDWNKFMNPILERVLGKTPIQMDHSIKSPHKILLEWLQDDDDDKKLIGDSE